MIINFSKGGADIKFKIGEYKWITMEVKNWIGNLYRSNLEKDVLPRFYGISGNRNLITFGGGIDKKNQEWLKRRNIQYKRIIQKQYTEDMSSKDLSRIKVRIERWFNKVLRDEIKNCCL